MSMTSWHCPAEIGEIDRPTGMTPALAHDVQAASFGDARCHGRAATVGATHVSAGQDGAAAGLFDQHLRFVKTLLGGHRVRSGVGLGERAAADDVGSPQAMRMAWARPSTRPTPVMNATLPSSMHHKTTSGCRFPGRQFS